MATAGNGSDAYSSYLAQGSSLASGCIVLVEPELEPLYSPDNTALDSNWGTTYCRLRRASELIGASAVAIDNKIEQAMDLVKSHLMFAVREEVEQLKLKIQELTDRNNQLEYENTILRASAPQETLAKLQRQPSILPS